MVARRYHLTKRSGKWLLLDPNGKPTFLRGANHYGDGTYMPLNLAERYGDTKAWRASVRDRHREWGFNYLPPSIGPSEPTDVVVAPTLRPDGGMHWAGESRRTAEWSASAFAEVDFPFTVLLGVPKQNLSGPGRPDVFSRDFRQAVEHACRAMAEPLRDNPNLIGYHFCHNPPWSTAATVSPTWVEEIVSRNGPGRSRWNDLMKQIYGTAERFRGVYGIPIESLNEVAGLQFPLRGYVDQGKHDRDRQAFMERVCDEWYKVYSGTLRELDPQRLLLGDRNTLHLRPLPTYAIRIMEKYIDVLSINVMGPRETIYQVMEQVTRHWDGPIHLADTGAGIYNGAHPKAGYMCRDLADFHSVYRDLLTIGLEHPQVIGMGWCGYYETPSRRSGLVDSRNDEPIADKVAVIREANRWMETEYASRFAGQANH